MLHIKFIAFLILITLFYIGLSSANLSSVSAQIIKEDYNKNESTNYIPQIYPTQSAGEVFRFNNLQPNDLIQVNETEIQLFFQNKIQIKVGE